MTYANEHRVRSLIALFGLLAMVLSGFHAGPVAAHESDGTRWSDVASHGHVHGSQDGGGEDSPNDSPADLDADQGHQHSASAPAPQLPQAEFGGYFGKQILFASEVAFLRLAAAAPPLDPPRT